VDSNHILYLIGKKKKMGIEEEKFIDNED